MEIVASATKKIAPKMGSVKFVQIEEFVIAMKTLEEWVVNAILVLKVPKIVVVHKLLVLVWWTEKFARGMEVASVETAFAKMAGRVLFVKFVQEIV